MRKQIVVLASIVLLGVAGSSWASEFLDGFEAYTAGAGAHGQGGWKGWNDSAAADAIVSDRVAHAGRNSIDIAGDADLVHEFSFSGGKRILLARQYIPSGGAGTSYFILLNTYSDRGDDDWSVQTEYNLTDGTITPLHGEGTARIVYDQWVEIKFFIDLTANTVEEYYNGVRIAAGAWDDDEHGTLQAIDLYAGGASSVYYDDIQIDSAVAPVPVATFPRPSYDSGWIPTPFGSPSEFYTIRLDHGLGGNTDNYFVDLQTDVSGIAGPNLTNQGFGTTFWYNFLTPWSVNVTAPYSAVDLVTAVRVRIWVYEDAAPMPVRR